jgi:hypothetical protein
MIIELACENVRIEGGTAITKKHLPFIKVSGQKFKEPVGYSADFFNAKENRELTVLRQNHFKMELSEEELQYKRGSRTLSHHLRGMSLKALACTDWNTEETSRLITGGLNSKVYEAIMTRIEGYIKNIREKGMTPLEHSLFKNLPSDYKEFLEKAISYYKSNAVPSRSRNPVSGDY